MKNSLIYYLTIFIPLLVLYVLIKSDSIEPSIFVLLILFYALVYRGISDYYRLISRNAIEKREFWKLLIPGSRIKYFKQLYSF